MKKYRHRQRGSVTVFLTLILIPTIFLSGLLTDLARVKCYSNQALMTADNYGEAILTEYDNLLKELYGLFAVTQDEEGQQAIETLQEYMKTSFDPTGKTIEFGHLNGTILNKGTSYEGFMPYQSAELDIGYEACEGANLANTSVLSTQIGDFMRYRIIQSMTDDGDALLDALGKMENSKADADVMDAKQDLDDQVNKALKAQEEYYLQLLKMDSYVEDYLKGLNHSYQNVKRWMNSMVETDRYLEYIETAKNRANQETQENEEITGEEETEGNEEDTLDLEEEGSFFASRLDSFIKQYTRLYNEGRPHDSYSVTFSNYDSEADKLYQKARNLQAEMEKIKEEKARVEEALSDEKVSSDVKTNVQNELDERYAALTDDGVAEDCMAIAELFVSNHCKQCNQTFKGQAQDIVNTPGDGLVNSIEEARDYYLRYYLNKEDDYDDYTKVKFIHDIEISHFDDFKQNSSYNKTYQTLKRTFGENTEDSSVEKQAKNKKKDAEGKTKQAEEDLKKEDDSCMARNIPDSIPIGDSKEAGMPSISKMIKSAATLLNCDLGEAKDELLLKTYTVNYDFGMFSSRVTNVEKPVADSNGDAETSPQSNTIKESLTGYAMCEEINYLYQAELEYLYGGHKSSKENLKEARNTILTFRMAMNLAATYSVKEINDAIKTITQACMEVNPVLGIAVAAALRTGAAAIESYADWNLLKQGESVMIAKTELGDLSAYDDIAAFLGINEKKKTSGGFKLNYEQYLMLLLIALTPRDQIASRTGDLICLNVNHVKQGSEFSELQFKMDEAVTAVNAYCSVHLNYVIMPDGFAQKTVDADTYASIKQFEKNKYKYSVVRGY